jgi:hypothetical protein
MITDKDLLNNELVFTGEIRLSDDHILQAWIKGHGDSAVLDFFVVDSSGTPDAACNVIERWGQIPAKHLTLLRVIVGNTISIMRERDEHSKSVSPFSVP